MTIDILRRLALLVVLVLLQALVLNHIHLFYVATPLLYIMLPLHFDTGQARWSALLWCFCTGLLVDIFSNTPGMAAGAMTLVGLVQPPLLRLFVQDDDDEYFTPTLSSMGWLRYTVYALILTLVFCIAFFTLEAFSFFNIVLWVESVAASTLFTLVVLLAVEKIRE